MRAELPVHSAGQAALLLQSLLSYWRPAALPAAALPWACPLQQLRLAALAPALVAQLSLRCWSLALLLAPCWQVAQQVQQRLAAAPA